ncbi:large ribosomal subunit protein mL52 isoform X1 [Anas platyrhynchos]|uniref:large ribosomal subunit protein mL52 isoform X1 n=1 Tax=Anas platyrhynchos TaxID=8839 RepID=UPI003AF20AC3
MAAAVPYNMAAPTRPGLAGATCWRKWAWPRLSPLPAAAMAARRALRLAELQARALQPSPAPSLRIGQWRVTRGLAPSQSGPGPLRDLPDWSFADGRPALLWRGQQRRRREDEALARRALALSQSLDAARSGGRSLEAPPSPALRPKGPQ